MSVALDFKDLAMDYLTERLPLKDSLARAKLVARAFRITVADMHADHGVPRDALLLLAGFAEYLLLRDDYTIRCEFCGDSPSPRVGCDVCMGRGHMTIDEFRACYTGGC
jgi:hypothetical protein